MEPRFERRVDCLDLARVVLAPEEEPPNLPGEHSAPAVVLDRQLSLRDSQLLSAFGVQDLLDTLQLHEVVGRAHSSEAEPRELNGEAGKLGDESFDAAVPV